MLVVLRSLWAVMPPAMRRRVLWYLPLTFFSGLLELGSLLSLAPFLAVVAQPDMVRTNRWLHAAYAASGMSSTRSFLVALGLLILVAMLVRDTVSMFVTTYRSQAVDDLSRELSAHVLEAYLRRPYDWFASHHSAVLGQKVLGRVRTIVRALVHPLSTIINKTMVTVSLIVGLFFVNPAVTAAIVLAFGGGYWLVHRAQTSRIVSASREIRDLQNFRFKDVDDVFTGIQEARFHNCERYFLDRFEASTKRERDLTLQMQMATQWPNFVTRCAYLCSVVGVVLFALTQYHSPGQVVPMLAVYGLAVSRIVPGIQTFFNGLTGIHQNAPILEELFEDLQGIENLAPLVEAKSLDALPMHADLRAEGVTFTYVGAKEPALRDVSVEIPRGARVAIVGPTGAGKTTLLNLLVGMHHVQTGDIRVDGRVLNGSTRAWRAGIGYVFQDCFLLDASLRDNIAFGIPAEAIDDAAVERAARAAYMHDFALRLPEGYATRVGERGMRLSQGQKQRVAIARALYRDPAVIVLDEATSALDPVTERRIMRNLRGDASDRTVILVTHRVTTVRDCERVFVMDDGRLVGQGTFDALMADCPTFAEMVTIAE